MRWLLVEYDDNEEASRDKTVRDLNKGEGSRVIGVFERPDDFCEHRNWVTEPGKPPVTQVRLPELGWVICTQCMKPIPNLGWLRNQLPPEKILKPEIETIHGKRRMHHVVAIGAVSRSA